MSAHAAAKTSSSSPAPTWRPRQWRCSPISSWSTRARNATKHKLVALCRQHAPVAIIVRYGKISARVIDACDRLRVISKHGTGLDTIDMAAAKANGIAVRAAAGANAAAVAEHTWALILACAKSVVQLDGRMHAGHWDKATHKSIELNGRTLGAGRTGGDRPARGRKPALRWACA